MVYYARLIDHLSLRYHDQSGWTGYLISFVWGIYLPIVNSSSVGCPIASVNLKSYNASAKLFCAFDNSNRFKKFQEICEWINLLKVALRPITDILINEY